MLSPAVTAPINSLPKSGRLNGFLKFLDEAIQARVKSGDIDGKQAKSG
jgi:hypothetical protein